MIKATRPDRPRPVRQPRLRLAARLHTLMAIGLAALLTAMVNYLSYRHYVRIDLTHDQFYALSAKTLQLLDALAEDVQVFVLFSSDHDLYEDTVNLLKEYTYRSDRVHVDYVDPHRDLARAKELSAEYDLVDTGIVFFVCAGRTHMVTERELAQAMLNGADVTLKPTSFLFRGEVEFSSAIKAVAQDTKPVVYHLRGHGERDIDDFDPYRGYSGIADAMRDDNIDLRSFVFGESRAVPADADALIIAGPTRKLSQPEIDLVSRYLDRNGRLLVLLDHQQQSGLAPLLEDWGLRVRDDLVVDKTRTITGRELVATLYGSHPITSALRGADDRMATVFHLPRSVEPLAENSAAAGAADRLRVTPLVSSSDAGWAETDMGQSPLKFDPGRDRPGPVPIAVAVEKGAEAGIDARLPPTRMIVFGDSDFASNGALTGGNVDLFLSSVNWLLERETLMAIDAKPIAMYRLVLSKRQLWSVFWLVVAGLPGIVAVLGLVVWAGRRN